MAAATMQAPQSGKHLRCPSEPAKRAMQSAQLFIKTWLSPGLGAQKVHASFFGVGAPEALLVGVVALIVFGPKGLAEVRPWQGAARPCLCEPARG